VIALHCAFCKDTDQKIQEAVEKEVVPPFTFLPKADKMKAKALAEKRKQKSKVKAKAKAHSSTKSKPSCKVTKAMKGQAKSKASSSSTKRATKGNTTKMNCAMKKNKNK